MQVPRILNPVVLVLDELPKLCKDAQASAAPRALLGWTLRFTEPLSVARR